MSKINPRTGTPPRYLHAKLQLDVINFVYKALAAWRDDPDRPQGEAEPLLSPHLCTFLAFMAYKSKPFTFQHQQPQGPLHSIDFSAKPTPQLIGAQGHNKYEDIVVFEMKRLPAPDIRREREYVTGEPKHSGKPRFSGGIQRFKANKHGFGHNVAAIIAVIQEHNVLFHHSKVNDWIAELVTHPVDNLTWRIEEQLSPLIQESNRTARALSIHNRIDGAAIALHHLWVEM